MLLVHFGLKMRKINRADISPLMEKIAEFLARIEALLSKYNIDGKL